MRMCDVVLSADSFCCLMPQCLATIGSMLHLHVLPHEAAVFRSPSPPLDGMIATPFDEARDKGKPAERRGRKATRLRHAPTCNAGWAAVRTPYSP